MSFNSSNSPCTLDNVSNSFGLENRFCKKKKMLLSLKLRFYIAYNL